MMYITGKATEEAASVLASRCSAFRATECFQLFGQVTSRSRLCRRQAGVINDGVVLHHSCLYFCRSFFLLFFFKICIMSSQAELTLQMAEAFYESECLSKSMVGDIVVPLLVVMCIPGSVLGLSGAL
jgi:hypothetical protein